jgi:cell division protein FtsI (penicillin-binding protein 3)
MGMTAKDAIYAIEYVGMRAEINGFGSVYQQSYKPGAPAFNGGVVELMLK